MTLCMDCANIRIAGEHWKTRYPIFACLENHKVADNDGNPYSVSFECKDHRMLDRDKIADYIRAWKELEDKVRRDIELVDAFKELKKIESMEKDVEDASVIYSIDDEGNIVPNRLRRWRIDIVKGNHEEGKRHAL